MCFLFSSSWRALHVLYFLICGMFLNKVFLFLLLASTLKTYIQNNNIANILERGRDCFTYPHQETMHMLVESMLQAQAIENLVLVEIKIFHYPYILGMGFANLAYYLYNLGYQDPQYPLGIDQRIMKFLFRFLVPFFFFCLYSFYLFILKYPAEEYLGCLWSLQMFGSMCLLSINILNWLRP